MCRTPWGASHPKWHVDGKQDESLFFWISEFSYFGQRCRSLPFAASTFSTLQKMQKIEVAFQVDWKTVMEISLDNLFRG